MQKRKVDSRLVAMENVKSGPIDAACIRYGYGRAVMTRIAQEAGAIIRIGRTVRYNYDKIDAYLDAQSGE